MVKAVIYARYSCELQREESIDGQVRECLAFAKSKGYEIINQYIDRAIIVWKVDRFARNRLDALQYKSILRKAHVKVISATENISDGPKGILLESVLDGLAEYYSADLAQKVKRGMTENVLEGKITGGRIPFGYKKEGQKYVIDAERASIVRELFNQYANTTITCKGLAEYVKSKGFLNGDGKPFKDATIYNMLRNEKYMGILRFGETVNTMR